jgi:hypothetical protein
MAIRFLTALTVTLAVGCSACGARPAVPTVTPRSTQITGLASGGLTMRIDILIYNPNGYDLTVESIVARVNAQGHDLGEVQQAQQIALPAGQNTPLVADITVPWGDLPSLAATALFAPAIPYHVSGHVRVAGVGGFTVQAPFEVDGEIPRNMLVPTVPGIGISL